MIGNDRKIKWGILGCGKIAHKFASDLLLSETAELFACASRDIENSKVFAEKYNAKMFFANYEDLAKCAEIDVIYIATPNSYHLEHSILCLNNQKAVLCEKPLCLNTAQVEELINVAKVNSVFLMEAMWTSCLPNILDVQNTIQSGAIGEIIHLTADFGFKTDYNTKSRLFDAALGGGSLLDIGIYPLYVSLLFLGKPTKIQSSIRYSTSGVDASCTVLLTFEEGKTATLFSSFETFTDIKCEIYGSKGKIIIPNRFHETNEHTIIIPERELQNIKSPQIGYGYFYEIEHVNECLYRGLKVSPIMPLTVSLDLIKIMDEIRL
jgi:predicted dehydrogenase